MNGQILIFYTLLMLFSTTGNFRKYNFDTLKKVFFAIEEKIKHFVPRNAKLKFIFNKMHQPKHYEKWS